MMMALFIAYCVLIVGGIISFLVFKYIQKLKKQGVIKTSVKEWAFLNLYQKYDGCFLTTKQLDKIKKSVQGMCVYSPREVYVVCGKFMTLYIVLVVAFISVALIFYSDVISIILISVFGLFFADNQMEKRLDKVNERVYEALRGGLSAIREGYLRTNSIPEALEEADVSPLLKDSFEHIYNILTTANSELKLKEFFERVPFRHLQTLARVCYDINNTGDEIDSYGHSNFMDALTSMSEDVVSELDKLHFQQDEFGKMEYLTLIPLLAINPLEKTLGNSIPAMSLIYDSSTGYLLRISIMISTVLAFGIITKINTVQAVKDDDRIYFFSKAVQTNRFLFRIAEDLAPKNYVGLGYKNKKYVRMLKNNRDKFQASLNRGMSKKTPEAFYLEKITYALSGCLIFLLAIFLSVQVGYQQMEVNVNSLSLVGAELSVQIPHETMIEMDREYMRMRKDGAAPKGEELFNFCKGYCRGLTELEIDEQAKRLESKGQTLSNCYFKWYYILIGFFIGVIAWFYPNMMLALRKWLISVEAEADFIQMQTLMSITMNTEADTLDALEQMSEMTQIHKTIMLYCYHSFPSNPDKELARLQSQTPLMEFKRFIGKMRLTTEDLSLKEAFSDLNMEREYIQKERDRKVKKSIHKKATFCDKVFKIPMAALVICEMIYPMAYIGITEYKTTMSSLNV